MTLSPETRAYRTEWMREKRRANKDRFREIERASQARAKERLGPDGWKRRSKHYNLMHTYGIGLHDYEQMLAAQGGGCAICQRLPDGGKWLHVDHCHRTDKIRGLLCNACNQGMIAVDASDGWCERAAAYAAKAKEPVL